MSSYVVLARKWRPAQFSDLVGQAHIVRTLVNAIRTQRIHQAYLFTGSRGIGKTSIARIFSKVLRCEHASQVGEIIRSCDECPNCKEITAGTGVDVIEIDGASNNGVEAVREIRENAKYLPSTGSRKIYIIDEVHMLTTAAFNALLKTLEEPPAHVIFIFATTEPHKIPATILSRVQRFDYRRVGLADIQGRLAQISTAEGVKAEPAALALIARAAEGSMRDALSLLDQVIAFSGKEVSAASVRESVGLIGGQVILGVLRGILSRKPLEALSLIEEAYQQGHDLRVLTRHLIEFTHGTILFKVGANHSSALEFSEDEWKEISTLTSLRTLEELELIFQVLHHGLEWIARSPQPKVVLDVLVIKCATAEALVYAEAPTQAPAASAPVKAAPAIASAPVAAVNVPKPQMTAAPQAVSRPAAIAPTPVKAPLSAAGPRSWEGFIEQVRAAKPLLASHLEHGSCQGLPVEGAEKREINLTYAPEDTFYYEQVQSRLYTQQLIALAKEYFGAPMHLQFSLGSGAKSDGESIAQKRDRESKERETTARSAAQNHPLIMEARSLFGGELGPIEILGPPESSSESSPESSKEKGGQGHAK